MIVSEFEQFVESADQFKDRGRNERLTIAIYGLASEIGSVVAAVKKRLLAEDGVLNWNSPNDEIEEELGDVLWYCVALSRLVDSDGPIDIFRHDLEKLVREIGGQNERAHRIKAVLGDKNREAFLSQSETLLRLPGGFDLDEYQRIAFLTARTSERTLVEVCLAVLWQLSAQIFRQNLPEIELALNRDVVDEPMADLLGEVAWHISALASIYHVQLSYIAKKNIAKVAFRRDRAERTPLHDTLYPALEQFPHQFEVAILTLESGLSQMYIDGAPLGDPLNDNAHDDDGYRFHDVLHLANAAKLGWSPVLRDLMGRERRSRPEIKRVEDGARAKIVEEAVIKIIHSEGERLAALKSPLVDGVPTRLFADPGEITFRFLKMIRGLVDGLEVHQNRYWEWEDAIIAGHEIFYQLRCAKEGTIRVDMRTREITFSPNVSELDRQKIKNYEAEKIDIATNACE